MKTYNDYKVLNWKELAFFAGITPAKAKHEIASKLFANEQVEFTKAGVPKVKITDVIHASSYDFSMRSNSKLDSMCRLKYLCDYYNNGTDINRLREYSENPAYIKAIAFSGINTPLNDILNTEQLKKLQKSWFVSHMRGRKYMTSRAKKFLKENPWMKS